MREAQLKHREATINYVNFVSLVTQKLKKYGL